MQQPQKNDDSPAEQAVARVTAVDVAKARGWCVHPGAAGRRARPVHHQGLQPPARPTNAILELADHLGRDADREGSRTGRDYWRPFYYLLEAAGLHVELVNART